MGCPRRCSMCASIAADDTNDSGLSSNGGQKEVAALLPVSPEVKARISILVVDDEHTLREGCASVLRKEGYGVTVSGRGSEARELVQHRRFDIVLVDLYLPQVDGMEILRATLASNRDAIVIVMTGNPTVQSSLEA